MSATAGRGLTRCDGRSRLFEDGCLARAELGLKKGSFRRKIADSGSTKADFFGKSRILPDELLKTLYFPLFSRSTTGLLGATGPKMTTAEWERGGRRETGRWRAGSGPRTRLLTWLRPPTGRRREHLCSH
jgi:hypothetical protein